MAERSRSHDELRDLAPLLIVGALTPEERVDVQAHLATCAECRSIAESVRPVAIGMAQAVPQFEPPAALRGRIVGRIAGRSAPSRTWGISAAPWLAAAAAAIVAVALGGYALRLRSTVSSLDGQLRREAARSAEDQRQLAELRQETSAARATVAILSAPDVARVDLAGQPVAPQASGRAFWSRSRGLVFAASKLPRPGAGRTYQLWIVTPQSPVSVGLLEPDSNGNVDAVFATPPGAERAAAIAVTIERAGGVPAPTGDKYLVGTVGGA